MLARHSESVLRKPDAAVVSRYPTEAQLASYLRRGSPTMPGFGMDQIDLRGLRDLVGYLRALP